MNILNTTVLRLFVGVVLLPSLGRPALAAQIPHLSALAAATVVQERIDAIERALVLGNGDLNALLWEDRGSVCLRVTKNDLWDARIDTSEDPPLLRVDLKNRTWSGGANRPPSWHNHPYPQPRCAAVVRLGSAVPRTLGWRCVRRSGGQDIFTCREGVMVMGVGGPAGASAGYSYDLHDLGRRKYTTLKLRVSGSANARIFVKTPGFRGEWQDSPHQPEDLAFPLNAEDEVLSLYVMTRDGQPAENLIERIWLEGEGQTHEIDLATAGLPLQDENRAVATRVREARLDLRNAVVTLAGQDQRVTRVRALADRNVFLIDGPDEITLEEVVSPQLPPAALGVTDGVNWLHMVMPGDLDYRGMEYALAVASRGDRKAVAMVTSFDTTEPVRAAAVRLAHSILAEADPLPRHEVEWTKFWSASGLELGDRFFQEAWYRNLYYMRCFCRAGTSMPITLYAGLASNRTGWHGAPTLNYNFEQVFWPMLVCNQIELMDPYVRYLAAFAPRGRWLAQETYGVAGLFIPLNLFGPEHLVAPEQAHSKNARQMAYVPWSYTLGVTGWALQNVWLRYRYQPDRAYLESVYPLLRDGAEFYANVLEQCRNGELGPSFNPEHGPFGTFNNPADLAYFRFLLRAATAAAGTLRCDSAKAARWTRQLARVPDYETTLLEGSPIVANWKGADAEVVKLHNIVVPTVPIFPAEQITWFSSSTEKALFERTLRWIKHNPNNSHVMINVARARLSLPEAYTETRAHFSGIVTSNGLFARWPGHGHYLAESWAFAGLTAELLLQSVGDVVRLFPAWPQTIDASISRLRAQGGFLVSAEQRQGRVARLEITSTVGGQLRLLSPWAAIQLDGRLIPLVADRIVVVETHPGQHLSFTAAH